MCLSKNSSDDDQSKTLLQNQLSEISSILTKNAMTDDNISIGADTSCDVQSDIYSEPDSDRKVISSYTCSADISHTYPTSESNATLVPESLTPKSMAHRSRTSSICSTDSRHSLTPNRSLIVRLHHVKLATETSQKLLDFYKILNENGSRLMPDGTVSMAGLAKYFRTVANLEFLLDLIEGTVQENNWTDKSSRPSTSRTSLRSSIDNQSRDNTNNQSVDDYCELAADW